MWWPYYLHPLYHAYSYRAIKCRRLRRNRIRSRNNASSRLSKALSNGFNIRAKWRSEGPLGWNSYYYCFYHSLWLFKSLRRLDCEYYQSFVYGPLQWSRCRRVFSHGWISLEWRRLVTSLQWKHGSGCIHCFGR